MSRITSLAKRSMVLLAAFLSAGCSTSRFAVGTMTPVLSNTVAAALRSDDPDLVGDGLPASLLLLQGMAETSPGNRELASLTSMLHFAYAFAWVEDSEPSRAAALYQHGLEHGWRAFDRPDIERAIREGTIDDVHAAVAKVRRKDAASLLWVCANWGMWIQLNLREPHAAADLARLLPLAERVAALDDSLYWGMPRILLGALQAARPVTLGGNLQKSHEEFDQAFALSGRNMLLAQVFFAKWYCVQAFDAKAFDSSLREVLDAPPGRLPDAELLNRIAKRKAEALRAREEEIFD
ncbi:MAG: TRAP transporter TatT component family protein [bacterium]